MSEDQYLFPLGTTQGVGDDLEARVKPNLWLLQANEIPPLLFTPEEVASALSIGRAKVYDMIREGSLRSVKIGGSRRVSAQALVECVSSLEAEGDQ